MVQINGHCTGCERQAITHTVAHSATQTGRANWTDTPKSYLKLPNSSCYCLPGTFGYGIGGSKLEAITCLPGTFGYGIGGSKLKLELNVGLSGWETGRSPALADKLPAKAIASSDASILGFI